MVVESSGAVCGTVPQPFLDLPDHGSGGHQLRAAASQNGLGLLLPQPGLKRYNDIRIAVGVKMTVCNVPERVQGT